MKNPPYMSLDNLDYFMDVIAPLIREPSPADADEFQDGTEDGDLFCPPCQQPRRMKIVFVNKSGIATALHLDRYPKEGDSSQFFVWGQLTIKKSCVPRTKRLFKGGLQCHSKYTALIHKGPSGAQLVIFPEKNGGLSSPNTPKNVLLPR
jgi:hypothetical protein